MVLGALGVGCGKGTAPGALQPENVGDKTSKRDSEYILGRWEIKFQSVNVKGVGSFFVPASPNTGSGSHTIGAIVGNVNLFHLSDTNFSTPIPTDGILSYGHLDIDILKENNLRHCGANHDAKCASAGLRVYTSGTPGAGLWNDPENYGLPIYTSGAPIGLGVGNAILLANIPIGNLHVMKLCFFTQSSCEATPQEAFQVPISVDFTDAAEGNYYSTLVVEYFLQ